MRMRQVLVYHDSERPTVCVEECNAVGFGRQKYYSPTSISLHRLAHVLTDANAKFRPFYSGIVGYVAVVEGDIHATVHD